jgi:DNA-binding NtrC family response regulator
VDDEPTVRMLITEVLEGLGYAAIEAADATSGLKVLQSNLRIDLLIADVRLPGSLTGLQMAEAARMDRPELKVLLITGYPLAWLNVGRSRNQLHRPARRRAEAVRPVMRLVCRARITARRPG